MSEVEKQNDYYNGVLESARMTETVSMAEVHDAFWFLLINTMDLEIKDDEGRDICPMSGFCETCDNCFLDRYMESFPRQCDECGVDL